MLKFKVGDKIKLVEVAGTIDLTAGKIYEVIYVGQDGYPHIIDDIGERSWWRDSRFELVSSEYLTPEQVFKALQDKQELQYMYEYTTGIGDYVVGWRDCSNPQFANILNRNWRIKPVPKTIDYYGTELPKPITKAEAIKLGLVEVYTVQLATMIVRGVSLDHIGESGVLCWATESDAKLVLDTLLKPFKQ